MPLQPPNAEESIAGIKYGVLVFSFLGAAVSLSYAKELTRAQAVTAVLTGTAVAVMAAPLALHYLEWPASLERAVGFFAGLAAMRGVPVILALIDRLRDIKLPWLSDPTEPKE